MDTHCHLTYPELRPRIGDVMAAARDAGVRRMITVATSPTDARSAIELTAMHGEILMAAGIHPHEAGKVGEADIADLRRLHEGRWPEGPAAGRLVAVGETGLDFHYDFAPRDVQERVFREQLRLACDVSRPVIIHARRSEERVLEVLRDFRALRGRVVFHCFSGGPELARQVLDDGHWLSFTGVITFKNGGEVRSAAAAAPLDRIMVETDAPYLTPEPYRKVRPNEPRYAAVTGAALAAARGQTAESLAAETTRNAERFFGLAGVG